MFEQLKDRYGDLAGAQRGEWFNCTHNAVHNLLVCMGAGFVNEKDIPLMSAYYVFTPTLAHIYLADGRDVRSRGWTWRDDRYPELDLETIILSGGIDWTLTFLQISLSTSPDCADYARIMTGMEKFFPGLNNRVVQVVNREIGYY